MSTPSEPVVGQVVHLLQHWGDGTVPPSLRLKPSLSATAKVWIACGLTAITVAGEFLISTLWVFPTPGLWFSLLFTAFAGGVTIAFWMAFVGSIQTGRERDRVSTQWARAYRDARYSDGTVVRRAITTNESGAVWQFSLTVESDLATFDATWHTRTSPTELLQSQVPGVGAAARVWCLDDNADAPPLVVEVLDPTVVARGPDRGPTVSKHVD